MGIADANGSPAPSSTGSRSRSGQQQRMRQWIETVTFEWLPRLRAMAAAAGVSPDRDSSFENSRVENGAATAAANGMAYSSSSSIFVESNHGGEDIRMKDVPYEEIEWIVPLDSNTDLATWMRVLQHNFCSTCRAILEFKQEKQVCPFRSPVQDDDDDSATTILLLQSLRSALLQCLCSTGVVLVAAAAARPSSTPTTFASSSSNMPPPAFDDTRHAVLPGLLQFWRDELDAVSSLHNATTHDQKATGNSTVVYTIIRVVTFILMESKPKKQHHHHHPQHFWWWSKTTTNSSQRHTHRLDDKDAAAMISEWQQNPLVDTLAALLEETSRQFQDDDDVCHGRRCSEFQQQQQHAFAEEKKSDDVDTVVESCSMELDEEEKMNTLDSSLLLLGALFRLTQEWTSLWMNSSTSHCSGAESMCTNGMARPIKQPMPTRALGNAVLHFRCTNGTRLQALLESSTATLWHMVVVKPLALSNDALVWSFVQHVWTTIRNALVDDNTTAADAESIPLNVGIMRNLSAAVGTMVMAACSHSADQVADIHTILDQTWLVPTLLQTLLQLSDHPDGSKFAIHSTFDVRRRCIRTIRCLSSTDWGYSMLQKQSATEAVSSNQTGEQPTLGRVLVNTLRSKNDDDIDTRILACRTLCDLWSRCNTANFNDSLNLIVMGPSLETCLTQIIENADENFDAESSDKLVLAATLALTCCVTCSPWKRSVQCFTPALFEQMLAVLSERVDQSVYHVGFTDFFSKLVQVSATTARMAESTTPTKTQIQGITSLLVSYPAVVEMMAILLAPMAAGPEYDSSRRTILNVLLVIVKDNDSNKKPMADDESLLTALVNVCLMTSNEGQLKDDAKQLILALVPEL